MPPTRTELRRQMGMLKFRKGLSILQADGEEQCISSFFHICYLDLFLLPLYYAWERLEYGSIHSAHIEDYLLQTYYSFKDDAENSLGDLIQIIVNSKCPESLINQTLQLSLLVTLRKIKTSLF